MSKLKREKKAVQRNPDFWPRQLGITIDPWQQRIKSVRKANTVTDLHKNKNRFCNIWTLPRLYQHIQSWTRTHTNEQGYITLQSHRPLSGKTHSFSNKYIKSFKKNKKLTASSIQFCITPTLFTKLLMQKNYNDLKIWTYILKVRKSRLP